MFDNEIANALITYLQQDLFLFNSNCQQSAIFLAEAFSAVEITSLASCITFKTCQTTNCKTFKMQQFYCHLAKV